MLICEYILKNPFKSRGLKGLQPKKIGWLKLGTWQQFKNVLRNSLSKNFCCLCLINTADGQLVNLGSMTDRKHNIPG